MPGLCLLLQQHWPACMSRVQCGYHRAALSKGAYGANGNCASLGVANTFPSTPPASQCRFRAVSSHQQHVVPSIWSTPTCAPHVYQYNLSLQHNLFADTVLETNYVGSSGHGLTSLRDINPMVLAKHRELPVAYWTAVAFSASASFRSSRTYRMPTTTHSKPALPGSPRVPSWVQLISPSPIPTVTIWTTHPGSPSATRRCRLTARIFSTPPETATCASVLVSAEAGTCLSIGCGQGVQSASPRDGAFTPS